MADDFRILVMEAEKDLKSVSSRERRSIQSSLAENCNQLAWLLANCEVKPE